MMIRKLRLLPALTIALVLAACETAPKPTVVSAPQEAIGLKGGLIGLQVGLLLSEADRKAALDAEYRALEFGRAGSPVNWRGGPEGIYGEVIPEAPYTIEGNHCRDYIHTIYARERPRVGRGTACRNADGSWRMAG